MDSLRNFPRDFPFSIRLANMFIRGGDRASTAGTAQKKRRPRMTEDGLRKLLERHGKELTDDAEEAEGKSYSKNN